MSKHKTDGLPADGSGAARPRRQLLAGAAGALGAVAAETMARSTPAQADTGQPVLQGVDNGAPTTRTALFTASKNEYAILADPGTKSVGVQGFGQDFGGYFGDGSSANGHGVGGLGSGSGSGVDGNGGPNDGVGGRFYGGGNGPGVQGTGGGNGTGVVGTGGPDDGTGGRFDGTGNAPGIVASGGLGASPSGPNYSAGGIFNGAGNASGVTGTGGPGDGAGVVGEGGGSLGLGVLGFALAGVKPDGLPRGAGVLGVGQGGLLGVAGWTVSGDGVHGFATDAGGVGVVAENTAGGTALRVSGAAVFSSSGMVTISAGSSRATVTGVALTAASLVLATLQQDMAGVFVRSAVPDVAGNSFTVHLNRAISASAAVAWFVIN